MKFLTRSNALAALAATILGAMQAWGAYDDYWWFDNAGHFTGGIMVAAALGDEDSSILMDLLLTLGVATLWEGFEAWHGVAPWDGEKSYNTAVEDTFLDTLLVLGGALLASKAAKDD